MPPSTVRHLRSVTRTESSQENTVSTPLLKTKLYVPATRPGLVARPRLIERLEQNVNRKLTLVSAPAGYGKTTLISEWISRGDRPAAWLTLDEGDNDLVRFFDYLVAALQQMDLRMGQKVKIGGRGKNAPPVQTAVTHLLNDLTTFGERSILVLDNYHLVTEPEIHEALAYFLTHQPATVHLVLSTRHDPPLQLSQLRAQSALTDIRQRELGFNPAEAEAFFRPMLNPPPPVELVQELVDYTEGWVVGMQLMALALRDSPASFARPIRGANRHIADYLATEVFQSLSSPLLNFMQRTAILDRFSAPLCDHVTGERDSAALLEQIEAANLFLVPLDHGRRWFRYRRPVAECLRAALSPDVRAEVHRQAAGWFKRQGMLPEAIHHALESGDEEEANRVVAAAVEAALATGRVGEAAAWLDQFPEERLRADGGLATLKGWSMALHGELALADSWAGSADEQMRRSSDGRGRLLVLRAFLALLDQQDPKATVQLARSALKTLPKDHSQWRMMALWLTAEAQERTGAIATAITTLRKAARAGSLASESVFAAAVEIFLAAALHTHGQRREALAVCETALKRYTDTEGRMSPAAGMIHSWLGVLHYEANQLDLARGYLEQGLALSEQTALSGYLLFSQGHIAPTLYALGQTEAALLALQQARRIAAQTGFTGTDWPLAVEAGIHLKQGDLTFVSHWAETANLSPGDSPSYLLLGTHLTYARFLLAQERVEEANKLLGRLAQFTEKQGLNRWLLSTLILQALAAVKLGEQAAAEELLAQAVKLAAPEDYYRAFLDEGAVVIGLLPAVRPHAPYFVDRLLVQAGLPVTRPAVGGQSLPEPISERELEVLDLIARGLKNREIAQRLHIATGTVKRHINNIYGKIGVHSRTEAIVRARELRLLNFER